MKELKRLVASLKLLGVVAKIENTEIETLPNGTKVETFEAVIRKDNCMWYVFIDTSEENETRFEIHFYLNDTCVYDQTYCNSIFDTAKQIKKTAVGKLKTCILKRDWERHKLLTF